jgi:hypothetical protein
MRAGYTELSRRRLTANTGHLVLRRPVLRSGGRGCFRVSSNDQRHSLARRRPFTFSLTQRRESVRAPLHRVDAIRRPGDGGFDGAGMRSLLVILIFFALTEPASACRRFSIWHYNFPQPPCPIVSSEAQAAPARAAPDIPLPDLTEIIWGETGDGRLTAIGKLRVLSSGR